MPDAHSAAEVDNWELLIRAVVTEAAELNSVTRRALASRLLEFGGYECVDGLPAENRRVELARRLAARLASET